ncbi:MAG: GAF domain-containing sensor histidine kinase [Acidimicrobiia bacterium]|nr:GAF domain-containing sensor histidine kinase [Acidimicrobiia bacterium]
MNRTAGQGITDDAIRIEMEPLRPRTQQAAVAQLGQAALDGMSLEGVFALALDLVCAALDVEFAKVLEHPAPDRPMVIAAGRGWSANVKVGETTVPCDHGSQAGFTLTSDEPIVVLDLERENRFAGPPLLTEHGVVSGMSAVIPGQNRPFGVVGVHSRRRRFFSPDDADFLRSIANVIGSAVQSDRSRDQLSQQAAAQKRRVRYQVALTECARGLLAKPGDDGLAQAVRSLLTATRATLVFIERNVVDPELGFSSRTVAEAGQGDIPDDQHRDDYWSLVPWDRMPTSRSHLERGEPFFVVPAEMEGEEYDLYAADPLPVLSELDIPIFVDGVWMGLIGFADTTTVRRWTTEDISLLTTAAAMIGAFWERELARHKLEELLEAKDRFLASVGHELRTPLTAVVGFGQILQDTEALSTEERRQILETLVAQGLDLTNIVNDLLVAAKADIGRLDVMAVPVNLRVQTSQVLEMLDGAERARVSLSQGSIRALGDPDRVRQILRNLISNALRYGGKRIEIRIERSDSTARLMVIDTGTAIPADDRERIFQPYQRAHDTPGVPGSLGLGLAISRQLARLMSGDLTYRHEAGESIFELVLPLTG